MFSQDFIQRFLDFFVNFATDLLLPLMFVTFIAVVVAKILIYITVKREETFTKEFKKRVDLYIEEHAQHNAKISFYMATKRILEKTFYESFKIRSIMKRRNPDLIMILADRVFLVQQGCARLVRDTLKQVKYLKFGTTNNFLDVSKNVYQNNPCFNKLFGIVPISLLNDLLGIIPGLFIIGGIFGTFLGIMRALPELGGMELTDIEGTKAIMDNFLLKISFSMSTSIVGIILSVCTSLLNTTLSPEKLFMDTVELYNNALNILWNRSDCNDYDFEEQEFDEHRDAIQALAETSIEQELNEIMPKKMHDRRTNSSVPAIPIPNRNERRSIKKAS